jgi:uncharacterized membrane protein YccC
MHALVAWASNLYRRCLRALDARPLKSVGASAAPALLFGLRLSAAVCLALYIALWFQLDDPYWAGTSASIVVQPRLGASLRKGRFRAIGTIVGGLAIVVLTTVFPQNHPALLVSLALWGALCGCVATILPNSAGYAAALAGYTAAVVFSATVEIPQSAFLVAVWRLTEIGIGIFCAELVHALTDFGAARERLARRLGEISQSIASGIVQTLHTGDDPPELRTSRRELIKRAIALDPMIDEAIGEPSHLRFQHGALQAAGKALFVALSAWRGIANRLAMMSEDKAKTIPAALLPSLSRLTTRIWLDTPEVVREICSAERRRAEETSAADVSAQLVMDGAAAMLDAFERVANTLVLVANPSRRSPEHPRAHLHVPDVLPVALNGLRIVLAVLAAALFWYVSEWPDGPDMVTFTTATVILFSARGDEAYPSAFQYAVGTAIAAALAVMLDLVILPPVQGNFVALALALSLVLVPVGMFAAGTWHNALFSAVATQLGPILLIKNQPSYNPTEILNAGMAIFAGTVFTLFSIRLLPPLSPARRVQRLLALTLRDLTGMLSRRRRIARDVWIGRISRRLAVMPGEATLEEEAQLMTALSVGEAAITLLELRPDLPHGDTLDQAFAELAEGDVAAAQESLTRFSAEQSRVTPKGGRGMSGSVEATLIADALVRHRRFFARAE